jgi:hypothetical protein
MNKVFILLIILILLILFLYYSKSVIKEHFYKTAVTNDWISSINNKYISNENIGTFKIKITNDGLEIFLYNNKGEQEEVAETREYYLEFGNNEDGKMVYLQIRLEGKDEKSLWYLKITWDIFGGTIMNPTDDLTTMGVCEDVDAKYENSVDCNSCCWVGYPSKSWRCYYHFLHDFRWRNSPAEHPKHRKCSNNNNLRKGAKVGNTNMGINDFRDYISSEYFNQDRKIRLSSCIGSSLSDYPRNKDSSTNNIWEYNGILNKNNQIVEDNAQTDLNNFFKDHFGSHIGTINMNGIKLNRQYINIKNFELYRKYSKKELVGGGGNQWLGVCVD